MSLKNVKSCYHSYYRMKSTIKEDFCVTYWAVSSPVRGLACQPERSILPSNLGAGGGELSATSVTLGCFSFWRCTLKKKKITVPSSYHWLSHYQRGRRETTPCCRHNSAVEVPQFLPCQLRGFKSADALRLSFHIITCNCASCLPNKINNLKKNKKKRRGRGRSRGMLYDNH